MPWTSLQPANGSRGAHSEFDWATRYEGAEDLAAHPTTHYRLADRDPPLQEGGKLFNAYDCPIWIMDVAHYF
jgi:hypothetical protein